MIQTVYLASPAFLFLLGFCSLWIGVPLSALLLWSLLRCHRHERDAMPCSPMMSWLAPITGALLMAFATGFPSGVFPSDWIKHWALLNELSVRAWPVDIELLHQSMTMRFYVGAYLVPAGLAKLSALPVWMFTALWFTLGYALVLHVVTRTVGTWRGAWVAVAVFLLMAGADAYAEHLLRWLHDLPAVPWLGIHYEAWVYNAVKVPLEYSSMLCALAWVPHQSIAAFLVAGMLIGEHLQRRPASIALALGLLSLWSPYAMVGLMPVTLTYAWSARESLRDLTVMLAVAAGGLFALVVAWYLLTDLSVAGSCFACLPERLGRLINFLPFMAVELGTFALILRGRLLRDRLCLASLLTLLALPLVYGQTGDFVMRASLGPLFILALRSAQTVAEWAPGFRGRMLMIVSLGLSAPTVLSEVVYLREGGARHRVLLAGDPLAASWMPLSATRLNYTAEEFFDLCGWKFLNQYFTPTRPAVLREQAGESNGP